MTNTAQPTRAVARDRATSWRCLLVVFVVALVLRAGWGGLRLARSADCAVLEFPDEQQYWLMAQSLRAGEGLVDELGFRATRMPLYPGLLALFPDSAAGVVSAKALHWVFGALAAVATAWTAGVMLGRRAAWLAGLAVAGDPFLVFFSSLLLTETLFVGALIWLWGLMWWRLRSAEPGGWRSWLTIGGLAALCIYVRESSAGLMVLMLAVAALMKVVRRQPAGPVAGWLMRLGGAGAVVVLALLPWAARNASVTGDWCWLTHRGGISLYDGVGPQAQGDSNLGDIKQMPAVAGLDEVAWNRFFLDESWRAIREDPGRIARLALVKWGRLWNPLPNVSSYQSPAVRWIAAAWTIPTFTAAGVGVILLARRAGERRWLAVWLLMPAGYLTLLHGLFVGSVRYRLGVVPMLAILAAAAGVALLNRVWPCENSVA